VNIRDLLDLKVICDAGSLRKASEILGVSQPTLSARVARLEQRLGAPLFDRQGGKLRPTELTRFIATRADRLAADARRLIRDAQRLAAGKSGVVRVGVGQAALRLLMADSVAPLTDTPEGVGLELTTGHTAQLTQALLDGDVDMAVSVPFDPGHDAIHSELLVDLPIVVVAHPDHPLCASPPGDARDLFVHPFASSVLEHYYRDLLRASGIDPDAQHGRLVCSDFDLIIRAVAQRPRLFTGGPRALFARELEAGRLRTVDVAVPFRHRIYLHTNRETYPLPAVRQVEELVRQSFARLGAAENIVAAAPRPR